MQNGVYFIPFYTICNTSFPVLFNKSVLASKKWVEKVKYK